MFCSVGLLVTILYFLIKKRFEYQKMMKSIVLNALLICIMVFQPLNAVIFQIEFYLKLNPRLEAVKLVEEGQLKSAEHNENLLLPPDKYSWISDGGEVAKSGDKVIFYYIRGLVDNASVIVYSPDDSAPTSSDVNADIVYVEKITDHWYFVLYT